MTISLIIEEVLPNQGMTTVIARSYDGYINASKLSCKIQRNGFSDWLKTEEAYQAISGFMEDTFEDWDVPECKHLMKKLIQRMRFATECTDSDKLYYIHYGDIENKNIPWTIIGGKKYRKRDVRERLKDVFILYEASIDGSDEVIWVHPEIAQRYATWLSRDFGIKMRETLDQIDTRLNGDGEDET